MRSKEDKLTGLSKKELRDEILGRMDALDTSNCEFSDEELISSFERLMEDSE